MKRFRLLLLSAIIIFAGPAFGVLKAQEGDMEKEQQIQETIDQQKRMINAQKREQELEEQVYEQQEKLEDLIRNSRANYGSTGQSNDYSRIFNNQRNIYYDPSVFHGMDFNSYFLGNDSEMTNWDLARWIQEASFTRKYSFYVEEDVETVVMSVMGDCRKGSIRIRIVDPDNKEYSDIVIDEYGNLNWRKSFNISESENQEKMGEWEFQVTATEATGNFKISLQSF